MGRQNLSPAPTVNQTYSSVPDGWRAYTRGVQFLPTAATVAVGVMTAHLLFAQTQKPLIPTAPGTPGDPAWQGTLSLTDGRTFVTDGGLAIDAALARPATVPARALAAKVLEDYLNAPHKDECGFGDLTAAFNRANLHHADGYRAERDLHRLPSAHLASPVGAISHDRSSAARGGRRGGQACGRADASEAVTRLPAARRAGREAPSLLRCARSTARTDP